MGTSRNSIICKEELEKITWLGKYLDTLLAGDSESEVGVQSLKIPISRTSNKLVLNEAIKRSIHCCLS